MRRHRLYKTAKPIEQPFNAVMDGELGRPRESASRSGSG